MGHKILPDLDVDRSGSCSMFVEMDNLATKTSSRDDGLVARLAISTLATTPLICMRGSRRFVPTSHLGGGGLSEGVYGGACHPLILLKVFFGGGALKRLPPSLGVNK